MLYETIEVYLHNFFFLKKCANKKKKPPVVKPKAFSPCIGMQNVNARLKVINVLGA